MILDLFVIDKNVGIQIWHVGWRLEEIEKVNSFVDFDSNTDETYIVLEMKQEDDAYYCSLFYWLGSKSPPIKRQNAAKNAALLQSDVFEQVENAQLIFFGRAVQGYESENFCYLFGLKNRLKVPKLYRVMGSQGHLVSLLQMPCTRFYVNDPFVLDEGNQVTIWMAEVNTEKARTATLLAEYIVKVDLQLENDEEIANYIYVIDEILAKNDYYEIFFNNFLSKVSSLERSNYPKKKALISDWEIETFLNNHVKLVEYCIIDDLVSTRFILDRPLLLSNFESHKTYVLESSKHLFIYLGKDAYTTIVQLALAYAEYTFSQSPEHVTIVREGEIIPAHFLVHFADEIAKLLSIPTKSKLFEH